MDETLNKLADQAGAMHGGLGIILDRLAAIDHKLTDLPGRATIDEYAGTELLAVTDDLAQLADYVADLRARTAPAGPPSPDGEHTFPVALVPALLDTYEQVRHGGLGIPTDADLGQQLAEEDANRMGAHWAAEMHG